MSIKTPLALAVVLLALAACNDGSSGNDPAATPPATQPAAPAD